MGKKQSRNTRSMSRCYEDYRKELSLVFLSSGIYICFLSFGYFQEKIARQKMHSEVMLLAVCCLINCLICYITLLVKKSRSNKQASSYPATSGSTSPPITSTPTSTSTAATGSAADPSPTSPSILVTNTPNVVQEGRRGERGIFSLRHAKIFFKISATYILAMLSSNFAIRYISYPAQVLGKSLKPVAVLLMNTIINRTKYPLAKYIAVMAISGGIVLYSWEPHRKFNDELEETAWLESTIAGTVLVGFSLLCDGLTGSWQDAWTKTVRATGEEPDSVEAQFLTNFWACLYLIPVAWYSGELMPFFRVLADPEPGMLADLLYFAFCNTLGQFFIYAILSSHGSLVCSVVTTTRKFFTILLSVVMFNPNLLDSRQWLAVILIFCALGFDMTQSHGKKAAHQR